jgi:hypothetical protein
MNRRPWIAVGVVLLGCGVVFAIGALEQAAKSKPELPAALPEGALLTIEARDFSALLRDWNTSEEKRVWLASDNHAAFSNSRLFSRLSQAQEEFSTVAGLPTDETLLEKVAGKESCLGLYDIGNLEFVFVTRLDMNQIEATPLWQIRDKFEQRTEAGTAFYVHKDADSPRVAAFAARDGLLILGTREDLVAGVLDRLAGVASHNASNDGWYAEAVRQAAGERGDLRMVLNLSKLVPSPYFRSYWVQRNITEMKQYSSAVSDLYLSGQSYREERVLVRRAALNAVSGGDAKALAALAPSDAAFYAALASPDAETLLKGLRTDLLDAGPERPGDTRAIAPAAAVAENAGSAGQLDVPIEKAPLEVKQVDPVRPLRALLIAQEPDASLEVFSTRAPRPDRPAGSAVFVSLQSAMVVSSPRAWDEDAVRKALVAALPSDLTAGRLGLTWEKRSSAGGDYLALNGAVPLFIAVKGQLLLLANDVALLEHLLAPAQNNGHAEAQDGATYIALFHHAQEQNNFRLLMAQLDRAAHGGATDQQAANTGGQGPAFFSGDMASLSRAFSTVESERVEEKDFGDKVTQTVTYKWAR